MAEQAAAMAEQTAAINRLMAMMAPTPSITPQPAPTTHVTPPSPTIPRRSAKILPPDAFDGSDRSIVHIFLHKCKLHFAGAPELFPTQASKTIFAAGYLTHGAYDWFMPKMDQWTLHPEQPPPEFVSWENFEQSFQNHFGDPNLVRTKERELKSLKQTTTVSLYTAQLTRIMSYTGWNDAALKSAYYEGLKLSVKRGFRYEKVKPECLDDMIETALRIDNSIQEELMDRKMVQTNSPDNRNLAPRWQPTPRPYTYTPPTPTTPQTPSPSRFAAHEGSTPMELDIATTPRTPRTPTKPPSTRTSAPKPPSARFRPPLTEAERQRRLEQGLCRYCGREGHVLKDCADLTRVRSFQAASVETSSPDETVSENELDLE